MKLTGLRKSVLFFGLFLVSVCCAQEAPLSITEMKIEPAISAPGEAVLLSCRVLHAKGPMFIERVAATVFHADHNYAYTMFFDDGSHGDRVARDGVYSLRIQAPEVPGAGRIVFQTLAVDKVEIESAAIPFAVK